MSSSGNQAHSSKRGGEVHLQGAGAVARDQQQIKNFRRSSHSKGDNALRAVMLECKLAQGHLSEMLKQPLSSWQSATLIGSCRT